MTPTPDAIVELRSRPQWVCWRYVKRPGEEKPTKPPFQTYGAKASTTDPKTWAAYAEVENAKTRFNGVGFVVAETDPYCGIDLDRCIDGNGEIAAWALAIVHDFNSYTEISPSGFGLRIWIRGKLSGKGRSKKLPNDAGIEVYDRARFFTVTERQLPSTPTTMEPRQEVLDAFMAAQFPEAPAAPPAPRQSAPASLSDRDIIEKAGQAANGHKFCLLFRGDWKAAGYGSHSEADLALCSHLRFWTGADRAAMDRIFRHSLLFREKWDELHGAKTYGDMTLDMAISGGGEVYEPDRNRRAAVAAMSPVARPPETTEPETQQPEPIRFFPHTDYGNAERLIARHGSTLRFTIGHHWLIWRETHWEPDRTQAVMRRAKATVRAMYAEAARIEDEEIRKAHAVHARKSESAPRLKAMVDLAQSEPGVSLVPEAFDLDPHLFNCENGTIELKGGALREHRRDDLITKRIPIDYDKHALCPRWDRFIDEITCGDTALAGYLRRAVGYSLTGDVREQCLFFLYGTGANGKGTFLEILQRLLGEYATAAAPGLLLEQKHEQHPTAIADLAGRRAVVSSEVGEGKRMAEELVKRMTGGDRLKGRKMRADFVEFAPQYKLWLMANHKPIIKGTDHGIWRRIHTVPFSAKYYDPGEALPGQPLKDPTLVDALVAELPGILAWAVRGCMEWQKMGLARPEAVLNATESYREEMDILGGFLADRCVQNPNARANAGELYMAYQAWCQATGEHAATQTAFGRALTERGFRKDLLRNVGRVWEGIGILDTTDQTDRRLGE